MRVENLVLQLGHNPCVTQNGRRGLFPFLQYFSTPRTEIITTVECLVPDLPLWEFVEDLRSTDPTQETVG